MGYAAIPKRLYQGQPSTSTEDTLYTTPTNSASSVAPRTILKELVVANANATGSSYSFWVVPSGATLGDANCIFRSITIAAYTTHRLLLSTVMEAGDVLKGRSTTNLVTVTASGIEMV